MNKKLLTVGGTIVLGGLLLGATAYAEISGSTGYDAYKSALKNTITVKSVTPKVQLTVKDNGTLLADVYSTIKFDKADKTMSGGISVTSGTEPKNFDIYKTGNKVIYKSSNSNVYNVITRDKNKMPQEKFRKERTPNPARNKDIENVFDALAGNFVNYTALNKNADGSKAVSLKLSGNQISPVINAVASLAVKNIERENSFNHENDQFGVASLVSDFKNKLPKLEADIKINNVDVEATINKDNLIESQTENITLSGTDANGTTHQLTINASTSFSDYNSTKPDTVDLSGKQVKEIQPQKFGHESDHSEGQN